MKVVLQRVKEASVTVDEEKVGSISKGLLLLVGFSEQDTEKELYTLAKKVTELRVFNDDDGKMNQSLLDVGGSILSVSQFTLYGDCSKGRRPSFGFAARPEKATELYERFNHLLQECGVQVETGVFGAHMQVSLVNDGPVTFVLDL